MLFFRFWALVVPFWLRVVSFWTKLLLFGRFLCEELIVVMDLRPIDDFFFVELLMPRLIDLPKLPLRKLL